MNNLSGIRIDYFGIFSSTSCSVESHSLYKYALFLFLTIMCYICEWCLTFKFQTHVWVDCKLVYWIFMLEGLSVLM